VRDLMALFAVVSLVAMGFRNPFIAYMAWTWTALIALNTYVYSFMTSVGLNQIFALLTLGLVLIGADKLKQPFDVNRTVVLLLLFAVQALASATFAYPDMGRNWEFATDLLKIVTFCLVMPMLVTTRTRILAMVTVMALGMSFHGLLDGLKLIASGGGHLARGNPKFGDNNHFAVMLSMVVPVTYYVYQYATHRLVRLGSLAVSGLTVLAVVATHSRGGLLCVGAMAMALILNSRRKVAGIVAVVLFAVAGLALAPDSWTERMGTMKEAGEDGSFMGRVMAWKRSSAMAMEHPFVGAGLGAAAERGIYWKFAYKDGFLGFIKTPPPDGIALVAHSIYFQVLGDMGFVGFFIYMALLANAFLARREIRRLVKQSAADLSWAGDLADMLAVSLLAFMVGGALVSIAYQEFMFMILMLLTVLKRQVVKEFALLASPQVKAAGAAPAHAPLRQLSSL